MAPREFVAASANSLSPPLVGDEGFGIFIGSFRPVDRIAPFRITFISP